MGKWVFLVSALLAWPVAAEVVQGTARAIDGDTLAIGGARVRLVGIDAPERDQSCQDGAGRDWGCGKAATARVKSLIAQGETRCEGDRYDRYDRLLAVCRAGGQEVNATLVAEGFAEAYRKYSLDYVVQEEAARAARRGIWAGQHQAPEEVRHAEAAVAVPDGAPGNCLIKGNISKNGQIYHLPGSRDYGRTRIDTGKGERWFCTPAEAVEAGWRPVGG